MRTRVYDLPAADGATAAETIHGRDDNGSERAREMRAERTAQNADVEQH